MYNMAARTGDGNTKPRSMRIADEVWEPARKRAAAESTTVTAVVVEALREYGDAATTDSGES